MGGPRVHTIMFQSERVDRSITQQGWHQSESGTQKGMHGDSNRCEGLQQSELFP